jgi:16S rRNA processing protein RimM
MAGLDSSIEAGAVVRPHGIKGEVILDLKNDLVELIRPGLQVMLVAPGGARSPLEVEGARDHNGRLIVKFEGVGTRNDAEELRAHVVWLSRAQIGELPEGRYFVQDILGLSVLSDTGERLGTVDEVLSMPANDVYVVRGEGGEILIPVIDEVVREIDVEGGSIVVHLMEGLRQGGK